MFITPVTTLCNIIAQKFHHLSYNEIDKLDVPKIIKNIIKSEMFWYTRCYCSKCALIVRTSSFDPDEQPQCSCDPPIKLIYYG